MVLRETRKGVCCDGFRAAGMRQGEYGVALIVADAPAACAGVFTKNSVKAACVKLTMKAVKNKVGLVVANSGNANACTKTGLADAKRVQAEAAELSGVSPSEVAVASTGIIGKKLDAIKVVNLAKKAFKQLGRGGSASLSAAKALMTTDTKPKHFSVEYKGIQVGGLCKGSGMIAPDMATMLCFLTTNASISKRQLQCALSKSVEGSFNMVSVDGEESTNDMVLLLSSGLVDCTSRDFQHALDYVTKKLAKMIAADGEGASKLLEVEVGGAKNKAAARDAVRAVLSSPLIKTALFGENPNWGRVMARLGSTVKLNENKIDIIFESKLGKAKVVSEGVGTGKNKIAARILKADDITIKVNLSAGRFSAVGWGCDLTPEYVRINAEYN